MDALGRTKQGNIRMVSFLFFRISTIICLNTIISFLHNLFLFFFCQHTFIFIFTVHAGYLVCNWHSLNTNYYRTALDKVQDRMIKLTILYKISWVITEKKQEAFGERLRLMSLEVAHCIVPSLRDITISSFFWPLTFACDLQGHFHFYH